MSKKPFKYILAYLLWLVILAICFVLFLLLRYLLLGLLGAYYIDETITSVYRARFIDPASTFILGLLWVALMIWSEFRLRRSARRGGILPQFARFAGPLLILLFIVDAGLLRLQASTIIDYWRLAIIAFELLAGIGLTFVGWKFMRKGVYLSDLENSD